MKITEKIFNIQTGEETITERDETAAEKKLREKALADFLTAKAQDEANATARAALLKKLGITEAEAELLLA